VAIKKKTRAPSKTGRRNNRVYGTKISSSKLAEALGMNAKSIQENDKLVRADDGQIDVFGSWLKYESMETARLKREEIDTNIRYMRYLMLRGKLVSRELVEQAWTEEWGRMKEAFLALAERMAPELAALTDIRMVRARLSEAYIDTMRTLSETWTPPEGKGSAGIETSSNPNDFDQPRAIAGPKV
jgi:hypothetical protein